MFQQDAPNLKALAGPSSCPAELPVRAACYLSRDEIWSVLRLLLPRLVLLRCTMPCACDRPFSGGRGADPGLWLVAAIMAFVARSILPRLVKGAWASGHAPIATGRGLCLVETIMAFVARPILPRLVKWAWASGRVPIAKVHHLNLWLVLGTRQLRQIVACA